MSTLFGTPIIRSLFIVGAFMFFSFGLWNVLLLPFSIRDARRDGVRVRAPGGPDLGRLRRRVVLHGPLLATPARSRSGSSSAMTGHGRLRRSLYGRRLEHRRRDPAGHALGLLQLAVVGRPLGPAPAQHAARDARPRVLGVLRDARRHLPDRHGRRRPGRHRRHPAPDHRRLVACCSCRRPSRSSLPASGSRRGVRPRARLARRDGAPVLADQRRSGRRRWPTSTGWPAGSAPSPG